ncbi:hypothetical protein Aab01nite_26590 [Paractinoplanes abujensis]|nr:hypothetical protein Aab01nite_26590 [Actinoplanes abujensis]
MSSAMCSAGLIWSAVLVAALLAGVRLVPTAVAVAVAAVLSVPGVIAGVIGNRWLYRTTRPRMRWNLTSWVPPHVPHWAGMLAGVLFFGFWLTVVVAFAGLDSDVDKRDGRPSTVSPADADRQRNLEQQISLGVLGAVAVGGVFLTGAILTHHAAPQPTETQSAGQALA